MKRAGTVTIEDVARSARVSISTVSNVLNGREARMRADTLERVRRVIAELDFRPNQAARRLKIGHLPMIGLLVPSIANPFFGELARWVEAAAIARGYGVLLCNTQRDPEREQEYAQAFMAQGVQGVILGSSLQAQEHLVPLIRRGLAAISFDRTAQRADPAMDYVSLDNRAAGAMAAEHLISLGHRRIAYLSAPLRSVNRKARMDGVRTTCDLHGASLELRISDVATGQADMEMAALGRAAALEMQAQGSRATGCVAMNDMLAIGAISGLRQAGKRIPEEVSIIGIDDLFLGQFMSPSLTTVRQPMQEMATAAVERLLARMNHIDDEAHELVFAPSLVIRESTGSPAPVGKLRSPHK